MPCDGHLTANAVHLRELIVATMERVRCAWPRCTSAQVERVYSAPRLTTRSAGFDEPQLPASDLLRLGKSSVQLVPGLLRDDCRRCFKPGWTSPGIPVTERSARTGP